MDSVQLDVESQLSAHFLGSPRWPTVVVEGSRCTIDFDDQRTYTFCLRARVERCDEHCFLVKDGVQKPQSGFSGRGWGGRRRWASSTRSSWSSPRTGSLTFCGADHRRGRGSGGDPRGRGVRTRFNFSVTSSSSPRCSR